MSQILHIFKKDTLRFRIELAISLLLQLLFVLHAPAQWSEGSLMARQALGFITVLLPLSWGLLIARVVQAETLVGDRQFWITRPYEWPKLLAAKVTFLATWIGVPFLAMQFTILHSAGFVAHEYIGRVFFNLLLISVDLLLPLVALAAITDNFARFTLTLVGGIVALVTSAFLAASLLVRNYSAWSPLHDLVSLPLELALVSAIIVLQYATRRAWVARGIAIATVVLLCVTAWIFRSQVAVDHAFANSTAGPLQVAAQSASPSRKWTDDHGFTYLRLPIEYSGVSAGSAVAVMDARFTLIGADGTEWTSPWQQTTETIEKPITSTPYKQDLLLKIDNATYSRYSHAPVTLRLTFSADVLQADASATVPYYADLTQIPGLGICSSGNGITMRSIQCRSIIGESAYTEIGPQQPCARDGRYWAGMFASYNELNLSPVNVLNYGFGVGNKGSPCWHPDFRVTRYHFVNRIKVDATVPNFSLVPAVGQQQKSGQEPSED